MRWSPTGTRLDSSGSADPMIAGPNSTRRALNERARVLLKAAGELTGRPLRIGGREFLVGDEVVARRNDRSLHAAGSKDFVKNGSIGVVDELHPDEGEVTVRFEREGTIRIPSGYLAAGRLEHGYARTTYGVQGHTHDTRPLPPDRRLGVRGGLRRGHPRPPGRSPLRRRRHDRGRPGHSPQPIRASDTASTTSPTRSVAGEPTRWPRIRTPTSI